MFNSTVLKRTLGLQLMLVLFAMNAPKLLGQQITFTWITVPDPISASQTVPTTVRYNGPTQTTGDLKFDLGVFENSPALDVIGSIVRTRSGTPTPLPWTLAGNLYSLIDPIELQNGDEFTLTVTPQCGIRYVNLGITPLEPSFNVVLGGTSYNGSGSTLLGPRLKFVGTPSAALQFGSITSTTLRLKNHQPTQAVPGNAIILKYEPASGGNAPAPPPVTELLYGNEVIQADPVTQIFAIASTTQLFSDINQLGSPAVEMEIVFDLSAYCDRTTTENKNGSFTVGWNVSGNPAGVLCDQEEVGIAMQIAPAMRAVAVGIFEPWALSTALNSCYAGSDEAGQYFYVPYRITNNSIEQVKIRRVQVKRYSVSALANETFALSEGMGVTEVAISTARPVQVSSAFDPGGTPTAYSDYHGQGPGVYLDPVPTDLYISFAQVPGYKGLVLTYPDVNTAPTLEPGQTIVVQVPMRVFYARYFTGVVGPSTELNCPPSAPALINNYECSVGFDWACERIESLIPAPPPATNVCWGKYFSQYSTSELNSCPIPNSHRAWWNLSAQDSTYAVATMNSILYVGATHDVTTACFLGDDAYQVGGVVNCDGDGNVILEPTTLPEDAWNIEFLLPANPMRLWPAVGAPGNQILGLEITLDKYLYLNLDDLLSDLPIQVELTDGTVYSTKPVGLEKLLRIIGPEVMLDGIPTPGFCNQLDCPDANGLNGWVENMKLLLKFDDFLTDALWNAANLTNGHRRILRLGNARVKIPIRMQCPGDAGDEECDCAYATGCEYSPDLATIDTYAPPTPRILKVAVVQIPDVTCGDPCDLPKINLACGAQQFYIHCPGCTRVGIHNNSYAIERWNYGTPDANLPVRVSDAPYVERTREDLVNAPMTGDDLLRRDLATAGDLLWSELRTTIESSVPDYGPWVMSGGQAVPGVSLPNLYFTTRFSMGGPNGSTGVNVIAVKNSGPSNIVIANDVRAHIVHVGDKLTFPPNIASGPVTINAINVSTSELTLSVPVNLAVAGVAEYWYYPPIAGPMATPAVAELEFRSAAGEWVQTVTIDLTRPEVLQGGANQIVHMKEDGTWGFDLRPAHLWQTMAALQPVPPISVANADPNPQPSFNYLQETFDFMAPEHDDMALNIRVRWQVSANVGLAIVPVNVDPHAFLTMRATMGSNNTFLDDFDEEPACSDPPPFTEEDFCQLLVDECDNECDDLMYFCTKAGSSFNLIGYEILVQGNVGQQENPCDFGPGVRVILRMGEAGTGDAFLKEFRNFFCMTGASSAYDSQNSPVTWTPEHAAWQASRLEVQQSYGETFSARYPDFTFDPAPQPLLYNQLLMEPAPVGDGTEVNSSLPANALALADDGFIFGFLYRYQADRTTASGPFTDYAGKPAYNLKRSFRFRMDPEGRLPCPMGSTRQVIGTNPPTFECLGQDAPQIRYVQPILTIPNAPIQGIAGLATFGPLQMQIQQVGSIVGSSPLPYVWVDFCERPNQDPSTYEGLEVDGLATGATNNQIIVPESDPGTDVYLVDQANLPFYSGLQAGSNVLLNITVEAPCDVPEFAGAFDSNTPGNENAAEILVRASWTCASEPPALSCPEGPESGWQELYPGSAWLELNPQGRELNIGDVAIQPNGCAYHVSATIINDQVTDVPDGRIGFNAPPGWSYLAGSGTLTYGGASLGVGQGALSELQQTADPTGWGCSDMDSPLWFWDLGSSNTCNGGCDGSELEGLFNPDIGFQGGEELLFEFDIMPAEPSICAAPGSFSIYLTDTYCEYPCDSQIVTTNQAPIVPIPGLSLGPVGTCDVGATLTVTIDPAEITSYPQVFLVDIPDGLQIIGTPASQCGAESAAVLSSGNVEWTIGAAGTPCALTVQVGCVNCTEQSSNIITAGLLGGCCVAEVSFLCGSGCVIPLEVVGTPSLCGGPTLSTCGAFDNLGGVSIQIGADAYTAANGLAMIEYPGGTTTLTGVVTNTQLSTDAWWIQLYFTDRVPQGNWGGSCAPQCNPQCGPGWTYYPLSAQNNLMIGIAGTPNAGQLRELSAFGTGAFQRGAGVLASACGVTDGLWGEFQFGEQTAVLTMILNCDITIPEEFTPCNGSIVGSISELTSEAVVQLLVDGSPVAPAQTVQAPSGSFAFEELCNDTYQVQVLSGGVLCNEQLVQLTGEPPMDAVFDITSTTCIVNGGQGMVTDVVGGHGDVALFQVDWYFVDPVTGIAGLHTTTGINEWVYDLPTEAEAWVTITDLAGCFISLKFYIGLQPDMLGFESFSVPPSCAGCDGRISLGPYWTTGDGALLSIEWTGPDNYVGRGETISELCSEGEYTATITTVGGCVSTTTTTLAGGTGFAVTTSHTDVSCIDPFSGAATVSPGGGTGPYNYHWNILPVQTTATATGLAAGTYTCTVSDANNCRVVASVTIPPFLFTAAISSQTDVLCMGAHTGSAVVSVSGGAAPYTYSWIPNVGNSANISQVGAGSYSCTVTDAGGCQRTVTAVITEPAQGFVASLQTQINVACNGANTGSAAVTADHGVGVITYAWNTVPPQTTATATGLVAGTYACTVADGSGCSVVVNVTIAQPTTLPVATSTATNVACYGGLTGNATVTVIGGTPPYSYQWDPGVSISANLTNVGAGSYLCAADDANFCTAYVTVVISEPPVLQTSLSTTNGDCSSNCSGAALASVSGGTAGYSLSWTPTPGAGQGTLNVSGLCPQTYTFTATDSYGCQNSTAALVTNACAGPPILNCQTLTGLNKATASISCAPVASATSYQFEFTNDCPYSKVNPGAGSNPTVALNFSYRPLVECEEYQVRARGQVNGVWGPWGPECTITIGGCPNPGPMRLLNAQCGSSASTPALVPRTSNFIAYVQQNACRYRFRIVGVTVPTYGKTIITPSQSGTAYYPNNQTSLGFTFNPVVDCHIYKVDVQAEIPDVNGVPQWQAYGPVCFIRVAPSGSPCPSAMQQQPNGPITHPSMHGQLDAVIFPNPNDGSVLHIQFTGMTKLPADTEVELFDVMGRLVHRKNMVIESDPQIATLSFEKVLAPGAYAVHIRTPEGVLTRNLVIER